MVMVQDVSGRVGHDPQADDQAADGNDPFAGRMVFSAKSGGLAQAERLPAQANDHEQSAENECEPCHDLERLRGQRWEAGPGIQGLAAEDSAIVAGDEPCVCQKIRGVEP